MWFYNFEGSVCRSLGRLVNLGRYGGQRGVGIQKVSKMFCNWKICRDDQETKRSGAETSH